MVEPTPARAPRASRGWPTWGVASAALLTVAALVVAGAPREPESVAHVRAYLTAVREGRVDDAMSLAGTDKPAGEKGRFVTPKALSDDWEIVALREELHLDAYPSSPEEARVAVAIRVAGGATAVSGLRLLKRDGKWTIEDPLREVTFRATSMLYAEVNGVKAPTGIATKEAVYALLPGAYRFYADVPGVAKIASKPVPVLPGAEGPLDLSPALTLTAEGERAAQAALNAYLDACVRSTELAPRNCPFGADSAIGPQGADYRAVSDFREVVWKMGNYPEAAVIVTGSWINLADRQRGSVQVTVTATEHDSRKTVRYSVTCEMRINGYQLAIGADGKLVVVPPYARSSGAHSPPVDSCRP